MYISVSKKTSAKYPQYLEKMQVSNWTEMAQLITSRVWSPIIWADGHRKGDYFTECGLCVLDVDDGMSLSGATDFVKQQGFSHLIATTKNHQLPKGGELPCDRFRIILRFSQVILDRELYRFNIKKVVKSFGADRAATDLARIYQPCREIVSVSSGGCMAVREPRKLDPITAAGLEKYRKFLASHKKVKPFAEEFIQSGRLDQTGGRKRTIYSVACELVRAGWRLNDIETAIKRSPIDWSGIDSRIVKAAVDSAARRFSSESRF